ncbi:MAG: ribosome biogenesis GTPase Der [Parachlamydiales bacterium]|nr:ribosome biogenesis GTPase Der [Parachlamydiales bacterium]
MPKKKFTLAIVGRPNVGKSALFNRICQKRVSIVDDMEGVTRDRIYADAECFGKTFNVIDTGGVNPQSVADFNDEILHQAQVAIEEADSLIMVVDATVGITDLDTYLARLLRRTQKPICLAINKMDTMEMRHVIHEFHGLGISNVVGISAVHGIQIADLLVEALKTHKEPEEEVKDDAVTIAIVGRANVGKSTLINQLLSEDRCIVSPIAGTTRDAVDIDFTYDGKKYRLIDTAGIRRKKAETLSVDKFAAIRTEDSIDRADICMLVIEAPSGITTQEKRIAAHIAQEGKGCLLFFNKWDLVKGFRMEHCEKAIEDEIPFLAHCPTLFGSALDGRNTQKLLPLIDQVEEGYKINIPTPELNRFIAEALQRNHPTMLGGKRLRIYYMVQIKNKPPTFLLFVNYPELMQENYKKYLLNQFRKEFDLHGVPVLFLLRGKAKKERNSTPAINED